MLNIKWKSNYFESIDPVEARRILDEELFGMESVKQRIIETVIQINRTHTLPAYGILLVGPAGTGKSQIAYLVAKILKMPWTTLDMSSINVFKVMSQSADLIKDMQRKLAKYEPNHVLTTRQKAKIIDDMQKFQELNKEDVSITDLLNAIEDTIKMVQP